MDTTEGRRRPADILSRICGLTFRGDRDAPCPPRELEAALAELQEMFGELDKGESEWRQKAEALESALIEARATAVRFRELFEYAPEAYVVTDPLGNIVEANHAATLLFGRPKEFLLDTPLPFYFDRDDRLAFYGLLGKQAAVLRDAPGGLEARLNPVRPKGARLDAALTATAVLDEGRRMAGLRWLIRDVTARNRAEESRRAAQVFSDALLEAARVLVLVIDADGRLLRTNTRLEEATGYSRQELVGRDWRDLLFDPKDWPAFERTAAAGGLRPSHPLLTRAGGRRTVAWSVRPLSNDPGAAAVTLAVGHDVTDLEDAQQKALRMERLAAIGQISAALAHESRNALQRAQACLERLQWKLEDQPEALDLVRRTQKAQDDLVRLYEDVREYAAPIRIDASPCDPAPVWREVWADLTASAARRDARLDEDMRAEGDRMILADGFRLAQVFRNLLENALAACADPVHVVIACRDSELAGRPALRIGVRDNGPGFTDEQRRRLFEPFFTTKLKGTGLGLSIVRRIVEANGGRVEAGAPPTGAEILFTLPRSES